MRRLSSKAVHHGRNAELTQLRDDRFVRCSKCGFMCHLDRDTRAPFGSRAGQGSRSVETSNTYDDTDIGDYNLSSESYDGYNVGDFTITGGCAFCGSLTYDKELR